MKEIHNFTIYRPTIPHPGLRYETFSENTELTNYNTIKTTNYALPGLGSSYLFTRDITYDHQKPKICS